MTEKKILIVITSDESWGDVWHTQLYWADSLSSGFDVIYIEPPTPWKLTSTLNIKPKIRNIKPRLKVYTYQNAFPAGKVKALSLKYNDKLNNRMIQPYLKGYDEILFWQFDTHRMINLKSPVKLKRIYHVVDAYIGNDNDDLLSKKANLVIHTSPKFRDHYFSLNKNVLNLPQGFSSESMISDEDEIQRIRDTYPDMMVLTGTLGEFVNFGLLIKCMLTYPNLTLLIVGPSNLWYKHSEEAFQKLQDLPNVHYLGKMHPSKMNNYVAAAKICLVAYHPRPKDDLSLAASPLKVITYLAFGKQTITTLDCEIPLMEDKMIYTVETEEEFIEQIEKSLKRDPHKYLAEARSYLESVSYDKLISKAFNALNKDQH